jgi:hypothetical protein
MKTIICPKCNTRVYVVATTLAPATESLSCGHAFGEGTSAAPLWMHEFGADYDVPLLLTADLELTDISWHNDVCPSFCLAETRSRLTYRLWCDHPQRDDRELQQAGRFMVTAPATDDEPLYVGDDVLEAVRILKAAPAERRRGDGPRS